MVISISINVSRDKHDCFIASFKGEIPVDVFTHPQYDGWIPLPAAEKSKRPTSQQLNLLQ